MKSQPSSARFTNQSLKKQVFKYTPLVAAIGTVLMMSGCSSDSSPAKVAPEEPITSIYSILTGGGSNTAAAVTTGTGGDGGYVDMYKYGGFSVLGIFSNGTTDASFTARSVTANLGSNALNVTADTTVAVLAAEPAAGTAYFVEGDTSGDLYISDGDGTLGNDVLDTDELPVSGISIAAATTLTLTPNNNATPALATGVDLLLDNDLDNNGTLTTANGNLGVRGDLDIELSSYMGDGAINTSGTTDGQDGGDVDLESRGIVVIGGDINTSGADSTLADGGDGGYFDLYSDHGVQVTGNIDAHGGNTTAATFGGGGGGSIDLYADESDLFNSGDMNTMGGNGDNGGNGNDIYLYTYGYGKILNSGNAMTSGGAGSVGFGGGGGDVDFYANGGDLITNADIVTTGGAGVTDGGDGGSLDMYSEYGYTIEADEYHSGGNFHMSGNIDTRGGNASDPAGTAGDGGDLDLDNYPYYYPTHDNALRLLGYTQVDTTGGNGANAGDGGSIDLYADYGYSYSSPAYGYGGCGQVVNEVPLITMGGGSLLTTGTGGNGGDGGDVNLESCYDYALNSVDITTGDIAGTTTNSATIDASGGANFNAASVQGRGGDIWLWGYNGLTNTADLTANGGNDTAADGGIDGYGGHGGDIELYAEEEPATNSGALTANGGDGEYRGGNAGDVELASTVITNSGDITGNGGNADATLAASTGGDGAFVEVYALEIDGATNTGAISHTPGTGTTAGDEGTAIVNGHCESGDCS